MERPSFITIEDIRRWDQIIEEDNAILPSQKNDLILREYCYAGIWLYETLISKNCPDVLAARIQFTAASLAYSTKKESNQNSEAPEAANPWELHQMILEKYNNNELEFESSNAEVIN